MKLHSLTFVITNERQAARFHARLTELGYTVKVKIMKGSLTVVVTESWQVDQVLELAPNYGK